MSTSWLDMNRSMTRTGSRRLGGNLNNAVSRYAPGNMHTPFTVKLFDTKQGKTELVQIGTRLFHYIPRDPSYKVEYYDKIMKLLQRMRSTNTGNRRRATRNSHDLMNPRGPTLHMTYIATGQNGYNYRRRSIKLELATNKVSIMKDSNTRRNALDVLFPGSIVKTGLHNNALKKNMCVWTVPCPDHNTIYVISHDVLFSDECTQQHPPKEIKPDGLLLLAMLGCRLEDAGQAHEVHLTKITLKSATNESVAKSKIIVSEAKLRKLVGNVSINVSQPMQRMYATAKRLAREKGEAARRRQRERNQQRANQGAPVGRTTQRPRLT